MNMIKLGYDDNLGLPRDFASSASCEMVAYHDVGELLAQFNQGRLSAIFAPAGALLAVKSDCSILAQATLSPGELTHMQATFFGHDKFNLDDLPAKCLGRVNAYCTTSYWAPLIYLMDKLPRKTHLTFQDAEGFEDMLLKTANHVFDASMIWERVYKKDPINTQKLYSMFDKNDLPTPVIIGHPKISELFIQQMQSFQSKYNETFFSGFTKPNLHELEQFKQQMLIAQEFFNIYVFSHSKPE